MHLLLLQNWETLTKSSWGGSWWLQQSKHTVGVHYPRCVYMWFPTQNNHCLLYCIIVFQIVFHLSSLTRPKTMSGLSPNGIQMARCLVDNLHPRCILQHLSNVMNIGVRWRRRAAYLTYLTATTECKWLGVCGVHVNSSILVEGALV